MTRGKRNTTCIELHREIWNCSSSPLPLLPLLRKLGSSLKVFFIHISSWLIVNFSSDSNFHQAPFIYCLWMNKELWLMTPHSQAFFIHISSSSIVITKVPIDDSQTFFTHFIEFDCEHKQMRSSSWWCPSLFHLHFIEFDCEHKQMKSFNW